MDYTIPVIICIPFCMVFLIRFLHFIVCIVPRLLLDDCEIVLIKKIIVYYNLGLKNYYC